LAAGLDTVLVPGLAAGLVAVELDFAAVLAGAATALVVLTAAAGLDG
jgi:hypothetical protein